MKNSFITAVKRALKKHIGWMIFIGVVFSALMFAINITLIRPIYRADSKIIINANNPTTSPDFQKAYDTAKGRLATRNFLDTLNKNLGIKLTQEDLNHKLRIYKGENSQIIDIIVDDTVKERAKDIADETADLLITANTDSTYNITVLDAAQTANKPIRPAYILTSILAFIAGFILSLIGFIWKEKNNYILQDINDIRKLGLVPIGEIPYMEDGEVIVHE